MATRIILDTDIGTDVDDCLALAVILSAPELKLEGVTCVYGDTLLRARMVLKLLELRGVSGVSVMAGVQKPLMGLRPVYWEGHEGQGLLEPDDEQRQPSPEFAPDFIARTVMDNPGQIHLIGIGPLTNIALAFLREPRLAANLRHLTIMGGVVRGNDALDLPYAEHNIVCDPEAAHVVFSSGAPITMVPLNVTVQVRIRQAGLQRIQAANTPFHQAVAGQLARYPRFAAYGSTALHDPLAVSTLIDPSLVTLQPVHVEVETQGRLSAGATLIRKPKPEEQVHVQLATTVDVARFEEFVVRRLER
jgi:purine nucleosidase